MWSIFSYSNPQPLLNLLFPWRPKELPVFNNSCNRMHKAASFWNRNLGVYARASYGQGRKRGTSHHP